MVNWHCSFYVQWVLVIKEWIWLIKYYVNQGQNRTMTVPWLKQFSLIIPCNIIFWVLHFFEDYSNWTYVKKGPAVVWESVARLCFVIYIHTTIYLVHTFSFSRLWRRLSSRWIHSLVLHSIYNVLYTVH